MGIRNRLPIIQREQKSAPLFIQNYEPGSGWLLNNAIRLCRSIKMELYLFSEDVFIGKIPNLHFTLCTETLNKSVALKFFFKCFECCEKYF